MFALSSNQPHSPIIKNQSFLDKPLNTTPAFNKSDLPRALFNDVNQTQKNINDKTVTWDQNATHYFKLLKSNQTTTGDDESIKKSSINNNFSLIFGMTFLVSGGIIGYCINIKKPLNAICVFGGFILSQVIIGMTDNFICNNLYDKIGTSLVHTKETCNSWSYIEKTQLMYTCCYLVPIIVTCYYLNSRRVPQQEEGIAGAQP